MCRALPLGGGVGRNGRMVTGWVLNPRVLLPTPPPDCVAIIFGIRTIAEGSVSRRVGKPWLAIRTVLFRQALYVPVWPTYLPAS
jgi:hypothetical protein